MKTKSDILVVGAGGFIGKNLSIKLIRDGYRVWGLSKSRPDLDFSGFLEGYSSDITDFPGGLVDTVVFCAGSLRPNSKIESIVDGVLPEAAEALRFAELCNARGVQRFVMISSGGTIYGNSGSDIKKEDSALNPISPYGYMHLVIDHGLRQLQSISGMSTTCLRIANVYGPGQKIKDGQGIFPALLNTIAENGTFYVWGDGSSVRDYIFIDDVIAAIKSTIDFSGKLPPAINVGSASGTTVNQILDKTNELYPGRLKIKYKDARSVDVSKIVLDNTLALDILGWKSSVSLYEGIERFFKFQGV